MSEPGEIDYEHFNVHVLTNVLKTFLREMPEPLLTFDRYDDFLRAADLSDDNDRVQTLLSLIKKLPPTHHALLERIIFHLALVAQREQYNRMSASSLAIVFAPCVLRTNRNIPAQDSLNDISRQTKCMETLITQKMLNVKSTLADIDTLDTAAHTATTRLSTLRSSKVFTPEEFTATARARESEAEEMLLEGHIQEIKKEKALLTSTLPSLARASSDDDLLSTDLDGEGGSLDDLSKDKEEPSPKDSIESMSLDASSSHEQDQLAISYNLRDRNIDYVAPSSGGKGSFLGRSAGSAGPGKSLGDLRNATCSINSAANIMKSSNGEGSSSRCELQRQKPIVMRSISGGYEGPVTQQPKIPTSSSSIGILQSTRPPSSGNEERKSKRQNSIEDEPIMV